MKRIATGTIAAIAVLAFAVTAIYGVDRLKATLAGGAFAAVALVAGVLGLAFGLAAMRSARTLRQDMDRVALTLDGALRTLASLGSRNASTIEELADAVNRDIGRLTERLDRTDVERPAAPAAASGNVVALPVHARTPRSSKAATERQAQPSANVVPAGSIEIHLEPIVSIADSAATGFEAHAGVRLVTGDVQLTRRLSDLTPVRERIQFELALFDAVVTASRRQLGGSARELPIHVAVSRALIEDSRANARMLDAFRLHSGLEGRIVLSLTEAPTASAAAYAKALARLAQSGALLALETAPDADVAAELASSGIDYLKLPADRLLDRERSRASRSGADIAHECGAANIAVVATGVATDEDVLALMDLGVNLMSGARFSGPRRLKPALPDPSSAASGG